MRKATFFTDKHYLDNRQFDTSEKVRDNCLYMFYLLKAGFERIGVDLSTQDINAPSHAEFIIYNEMPDAGEETVHEKDNYLLMMESKIERMDNWDLKRHTHFRRIFTCFDELVDNERYIKINYGQKIPDTVDFDTGGREKLCTMIAGHKLKRHPLELYSERVKAIRWFESHHPDDFDLYGMGWDMHYFQGPFRKLNTERFVMPVLLRKLLAPDFKSYRGPVRSKNETLRKYRFAICYENARDVPGYITEKIFDCFFAGCIPIYLGAPNVTDYIPETAFIDKRNFKTYEELYRYIKGMGEETYRGYGAAIQDFVRSGKIHPFSAGNFAKTIIDIVLSDRHS
ncbi:MAG: glycosyltransferase family 10 [Deltaproteobacteria bacterium]|nr:glycosyltransferase family 10 [Deltaproteobacteria bacterium]MCL5277890.1 glycosyltransferase family 10 [Deltaproteobacteria bacterium]